MYDHNPKIGQFCPTHYGSTPQTAALKFGIWYHLVHRNKLPNFNENRKIWKIVTEWSDMKWPGWGECLVWWLGFRRWCRYCWISKCLHWCEDWCHHWYGDRIDEPEIIIISDSEDEEIQHAEEIRNIFGSCDDDDTVELPDNPEHDMDDEKEYCRGLFKDVLLMDLYNGH